MVVIEHMFVYILILGTNVRRTYVRRTIVRCQVYNKELLEMSTGMIVTPSWENVHMNENLQFNPVFNELSSNEIIRLSPGQEAVTLLRPRTYRHLKQLLSPSFLSRPAFSHSRSNLLDSYLPCRRGWRETSWSRPY